MQNHSKKFEDTCDFEIAFASAFVKMFEPKIYCNDNNKNLKVWNKASGLYKIRYMTKFQNVARR